MEGATRISVRHMDPLGSLYLSEGKLYRPINNDFSDEVRALLECGLIDELVSKNLFPATKISSRRVEGFDLVLEHERLPVVTYPYEWTFDMLKTAALCVLEVNLIANKYGYRTIDAHPYNIVFRHSNPIFVDLGSLRPNKPGFTSWLPVENFVRHYYYRLKIWSKGDNYLAECINSHPPDLIPHSSYHLYRKTLLSRLFSPGQIDQLITLFYKFRLLSYFSDDELKSRYLPLRKAILLARRLGLLPFQTYNFQKWASKIGNLKKARTSSQWGDYHNKFINHSGGIALSERLETILSMAGGLPDVQSVLELAGNQGALSIALREKLPSMGSVICTDYDEEAINKLFRYTQQKQLKIDVAKFNFIFPKTTAARSPIEARLKSDLVIALAVTHHLILTQKIPLDYIFERLKVFSNKYVIVEFMPEGLWSPESKNLQPVPEWYNARWFEQIFRQHFNLLHSQEVARNRIVFMGSKSTD